MLAASRQSGGTDSLPTPGVIAAAVGYLEPAIAQYTELSAPPQGVGAPTDAADGE